MNHSRVLKCIKDYSNGLMNNFTKDKYYPVISNYKNTISIIDNSGYKVMFGKDKKYNDPPYVWRYFEYSEEIDKNIDTLY